jgi:predicted amino acid dehydrogenase
MTTPTIAALHLRPVESHTTTVTFLSQTITIRHFGCDGSLETMAARIAELDGAVDAIALLGIARSLRLGKERVVHQDGDKLFSVAASTPVVDGSGVRAAMERWAVRLAADAQPGIWARKRVLMTPGLNHVGLAQALGQYTDAMRYADPFIYFALPGAPLVGYEETLETFAGRTLSQLAEMPFNRIFPRAGAPNRPRSSKPFEWADVLAGDIGAIRRYAPAKLKRKTIVTENASEEDIADLTERGARILVTTMPPMADDSSELTAATFEACLVALRPDRSAPLNENTYLNLMADLEWSPKIRFLQPGEQEINYFAFVIHPLAVRFVHKHPAFRWTRFLPDAIVEPIAAAIPPLYLSRITGVQSPTTGQKVEGYLLSIGATPKELMRRDAAFTYRRLIRAARMAERLGARIMGLGAFTSVVGDAGVTVAQKADIAITSGNSLTVAATLEAAKQAVEKMGNSLDQSREGQVMVIGATGSIGAVCSRLLAQACPNITLVAPRPEKLIELKRVIEGETPGAQVTVSTTADDYIGQADLIITTTTALNTRILDITRCKPGAVICDIARPPDITEEEAALRPDVLVIESGEILLPGKPNFGYDIGLPPGVAYACLAETALLAMEGIFEDYTLGRNIEIERVKEMYRLYKKHQLQLSGLRSHGVFLTDEDIAAKRLLADELRLDPARLAAIVHGAPTRRPRANGHGPSAENGARLEPLTIVAGVGAMAAIAAGIMLRRRQRNR